MELLDPDALELRIAGHTGDLKPCPFCGRHPVMRSSVNHGERPGEQPALYQTSIFCDYRCNAQIFQNGRSREQAQQLTTDQWNQRVPPVASEVPA